MKNEYESQAEKFLTDTNSNLTIEFLKNDYHFQDDKEKRDVYKCTIKRGSRKYTFNFGNSIANSGFAILSKNGNVLRRFNVPDDKRNDCIKKGFGFSGYAYLLPFPISQSESVRKPIAPNCYSILACLTKYDPDTFENFCSEYGYDTDSRTAKKTYKAVKKEWQALAGMFTDAELELMAEIQ